MRPSLRLRLVAAFSGVIVLTLLFASMGTVLLLRDQQTEFARQRFGRLVEPFAFRVQQMEIAGLSLTRIRAELLDPAGYYEIRILLLDQDNRVIVDTDGDEALLGAQLNVSPETDRDRNSPESYRAWLARWQQQELYLFVSNAQSPSETNPGLPQTKFRLVVAVPASDVTAAWEQLLPRQLLAGGLAFLLALIMSSVIAAHITRPLRQMTHASEAIAEGKYEQRIDATGADEVGQLARAFNRMAFEVGRSQRAMRQLVANMTHDLKTPLTSIQGFSQAIVEGLPQSDEEYRHLGEVIHEEAEHMTALVNDLLYLSRIESGELPLALDRVDLDELVTATARRFRFHADAGNIEVRLALGSGPIQADGRRLEQVFSNLLDNATRFAPPGTELLLRSYVDGAHAVVEVHNGGAPIPPEALPHVFDRFFQGDPSRRRGHQGLGLAIVQELVHAHGGTVAVQSSADSGTTFTVRLPIAGPPVSTPGALEELAPDPAPEPRLEPQRASSG